MGEGLLSHDTGSGARGAMDGRRVSWGRLGTRLPRVFGEFDAISRFIQFSVVLQNVAIIYLLIYRCLQRNEWQGVRNLFTLSVGSGSAGWLEKL